MTDEDQALHFRDYTDAARRAHLISKYGPGEKDKIPPRLRMTNQQMFILLVGIPVLCVAWYALRGGLDRVAAAQVWLVVAVLVPVLVAMVWHRQPVDGRTLPRTVRAAGSHVVASRGRYAGRWMVNGRPVGNARRLPKPSKPVLIPVEELQS